MCSLNHLRRIHIRISLIDWVAERASEASGASIFNDFNGLVSDASFSGASGGASEASGRTLASFFRTLLFSGASGDMLLELLRLDASDASDADLPSRSTRIHLPLLLDGSRPPVGVVQPSERGFFFLASFHWSLFIFVLLLGVVLSGGLWWVWWVWWVF